MRAWAPPSVTHHRAWHARGSCRPHISLQRRESRSTVMAATFFCCPFSGPCVFQTPRGSSLCSITHITIMTGLPPPQSILEALHPIPISLSSLDATRTRAFSFPLCAQLIQTRVSAAVVWGVSRLSTVPETALDHHSVQQAVLETETTGISTFAVALVPSSWCSTQSALI